MRTLLVVDDEPSICWGISRIGEALGHRVLTVSSAEQALDTVQSEAPDAIVLDVRLPGMDGLAAMEHLRRLCGAVPIIVITAYGDLQTAVSAVRNGAFEYLLKPFDLEQVENVLTRAFADVLPEPAELCSDAASGMIAVSAGMQAVFKRIALAAASEASVLLYGESGTGKELAARAIHYHSERADGPFVPVNVAALNEALAESELFGHARGAFTGAERDRRGLLAEADGGTLFLDEVADIPLNTQVKLLRVLEHGEMTPVGSNSSVASRFRLITATHQNLQTLIERGRFRHDLFYRIAAFRIDLPPLRERCDDIPLLARYFLQIANGKRGTPQAISSAALEELERRPWYGNVRELRSAVEHAMIVARGGTIAPEHLPAASAWNPREDEPDGNVEQTLAQLVQQWTDAKLDEAGQVEALHEQLLRIVEPPLFRTVLSRHGDQYATAAPILGLHRTTIRKKLERLEE